MNITCVNALAFVGGIGLAAAMQSLSTPPDGRTTAEEQKCSWQSTQIHQSSTLSECGLAPPSVGTHWVKQTQYTDANDGVAAETTGSARRYESW